MLARADERRRQQQFVPDTLLLLPPLSSSSEIVAPTTGAEVPEAYYTYVLATRGGSSNCKRAVEDLAKYDLRWTSWGRGFDYYNKYARADGYFRLTGDDAEAQNGFGGWVRVNYTCTYDPVTQTVKNVTLDNGRLPSTHGK